MYLFLSLFFLSLLPLPPSLPFSLPSFVACEVVEKFKFKKPLYTHTMSATPSHTLTAVGGGECKITLCDLVSGSATHVLECHRKPVMSLAWSPSSEHLLASGR